MNRNQPAYPVPAHERQELMRRLAWRYGQQRAAAIMNGEDEDANRDLRLWNGLGQPRMRMVAR